MQDSIVVLHYEGSTETKQFRVGEKMIGARCNNRRPNKATLIQGDKLEFYNKEDLRIIEEWYYVRLQNLLDPRGLGVEFKFEDIANKRVLSYH